MASAWIVRDARGEKMKCAFCEREDTSEGEKYCEACANLATKALIEIFGSQEKLDEYVRRLVDADIQRSLHWRFPK